MFNLNLSARLLHLFLLIIGISVGVFFTLCLKSLSFSIFPCPLPTTFPLPPSISMPPPPPPENPPPVVKAIPLASNGTLKFNDTNIIDVSSENDFPTKSSGLVRMHNMSDDELLLRASRVQEETNIAGKVAFMFLTPGPLPLAPFWDMFFKGHEGLYSIYVHTHPSYNDSVPQDSAFYGARIPSQPVYWGTISMIDAERRLLANAFLDSSNQRFVLLSDSCIPVFNFTTVYNYLMVTNHSFLGLFDDPRKMGRGRYNRQMWPTITIEQWRKGSQWFEIHRNLAVKIVSDTKYYQIFRDFCKPPCYSDEHYLATLVNILGPEMNSNRTITWVDWSRGGPHPKRFGWIDVKIELLDYIRFGSECVYNGNTSNVCHIFARKFIPNTLGPLLKLAPSLLGFDP
ncbi:hypothetical protein CASFOL_023331 [Castilleja foliolosa]|uniref:Core-2/I-branching beta-1,6-N-acetylglucosaminyltransferase family protein n=1 Tax=Castilleja foliolosa TaxID=1961234 RepID=A0ABD3CP48_9LAMI